MKLTPEDQRVHKHMPMNVVADGFRLLTLRRLLNVFRQQKS